MERYWGQQTPQALNEDFYAFYCTALSQARVFDQQARDQAIAAASSMLLLRQWTGEVIEYWLRLFSRELKQLGDPFGAIVRNVGPGAIFTQIGQSGGIFSPGQVEPYERYYSDMLSDEIELFQGEDDTQEIANLKILRRRWAKATDALYGKSP